MSPADQIATRVKGSYLFPTATCVVLGQAEYLAVIQNPSPCDPPDWDPSPFDPQMGKFCGLPAFVGPEPSLLALVVPIP